MGLTLSSDDVEGPGYHMPLLAWMDDLYVFCTSAEETIRMVRDICNACEPAGLTLQPARCTWATIVPDCTATISARGHVLKRVAPEEGLEVLGTLVSFSGDHSLEHNSRIGKAWRAFWANSSLLLNPRVGVYRRLSLLNSVVGPSPLWGAGGDIHSKRQRQRYTATQTAMASQIVRTRRRIGEGLVRLVQAKSSYRPRLAAQTWLRPVGQYLTTKSALLGGPCGPFPS